MFYNGHTLTLAGTNPSANQPQQHSQICSPKSRRLTGDTARRRCGRVEQTLWDSELPGFGLRMFPSGIKSWIVNYVERGAQRKVTLGRAGSMDAREARKRARAVLARNRLDGLAMTPGG